MRASSDSAWEGKCRLDYGVATRGKSQAITQFQGKDVDNGVFEILQRGVNGAADLARPERADDLVNGHDATHFRRVHILAAQHFELRIHHFATSGTLLIDFHFAVEDQFLSRLQAAFEEATVEKLAGEGAGIVLNEQMVNGVAAVHATDSLAAHNAGAQGVGTIGLNISYF